MKSTLYASVALACMAFAIPASAQQTREAPGRPAQTEKSPGAMKPDATPGQAGGAAAEKARPETGSTAQKEEKAGGTARGAENKADERPGRAAGETGKATAAEKKPDSSKTEEKADRARDDKTTAQGQDKTRDGDKAKSSADRGKSAPDDKSGHAGSSGGGEQARDKTNPAGGAATQNRDNARSDDRNGNRNAERNGERSGDRVNANASVNIDETQRSRLTTYFEKHRGPRVDRVDFDISVGVRIPERIRVAPLPREIVTIVPEYRGYDYVMVRDEIVILRPGTREIVTVIPASTSSAARSTKLDPCGNRS